MTMRLTCHLIAVSALALGLAACGQSPDGDSGTIAATDTVSEVAGDDDSAAAEAGDGPGGAQAGTGADADGMPATGGSTVAVSEPPAFAQCKVCHSIEPGQNNIGPSLAGMFGRKAGTVPGYSYTPEMKDMGVTWTEANLDKYLTDPQAMVSDTTMALIPLSPADRAAIIAYLKTL